MYYNNNLFQQHSLSLISFKNKSKSQLKSLNSRLTVTRSTNKEGQQDRAIIWRRYALAFSYGGALIQFIIISWFYFSFNIHTTVNIARPRAVELPSVSICFFFIQDTFDFYRDSEGNQVTTLTAGQLDALLPKWSEFMIECQVLNESYRLESCSSFHKEVVQYLSPFTKCYSLFENLHTPVNYIRKKVIGQWLVSILLNVSIIKSNNIGIYMTPGDVDLMESLGSPSFVQLDTLNNNIATVTFEKTIIHLRKYPYTSNCRDYTKLSCKNRQNCIKNCYMDKRFNETKKWFGHWFVKYEPKKHSEGRFSAKTASGYYEDCVRKFSQFPCKSIKGKALLTSQFMSPYDSNNTFRINIAYPLAKHIFLKEEPTQSFQNYICLVASISALWTQISAIKIFNSVSTLFTKFCNKKTRFNYFLNKSKVSNVYVQRKAKISRTQKNFRSFEVPI